MPRAGITEAKVFPGGKEGTTFKALDGVALNASEVNRTLTLELDWSYAKVRVIAKLSRTAATDFQAAAEGTIDGTAYAPVMSRSISSGTSTLSDLTDQKTGITGDADLHLEYDVAGLRKLKIVFSGTSGGGSDTVDAYAVAVVGS